MKGFLQDIGKFSILTLGFVIVMICLWGLIMPQFLKPNINYRIGSNGHLHSRIKEVKQIENVDILFIGSSHAYRGFDPRIFNAKGFTAFNLGSSGQTPINGQVLLQRYLKKLKPKLVVYEVFPGSFQSDGVESSLDIIANDQNDRYSLMMALKINHLKTYNTFIFGLFSDLFQWNKNFQEPWNRGGDQYISGGYVIKDAPFKDKEIGEKRRWNFDSRQIEAFEENLRMIEENGSNLLLVKAPVTYKLNNSLSDNDEYDRMIGGYGQYLNFNRYVNLVDSLHFNDLHHLNHKGVQRFNEKLLEMVSFEKLINP